MAIINAGDSLAMTEIERGSRWLSVKRREKLRSILNGIDLHPAGLGL